MKLAHFGPKSGTLDKDRQTDKNGPRFDTSGSFYDNIFSTFLNLQVKCTEI